MPTLAWIIIAVLGVVCLVFLVLAALGMAKPIKCFVTSAFQGLCALGLVNALGGVTGVSLGFSWLSLGMSSVLGIPGVIGLITIGTITNM